MMQSPPPQGPVTIDAVVKLLRDDRMRGFRIDIETDSLVDSDQKQERADAVALISEIGTFFKEFGPVVQTMPPLAPMASGLLQYAVRRHKVGAELEELIEKCMGEVEQHLQNPPPPQPNPVEQAKLAITQKKGEAEIGKAQLGVQEAQTKAASEAQQREQAARHAEAEDNRKAALHELDAAARKIAHQHDMEQKTLEAARAKQLHELTIEKMHHEAGIKAQSAEHDNALKKDATSHELAIKKDATSHDMALKEKQTKGSEDDRKASADSKSKLEKLFADISKALTAKKKVARDAKGDLTISLEG